MKRIIFIAGCIFLLVNLSGCAALKKITEAPVEAGKKIFVAAMPFYAGPKAKVVVADFEVKAVKADNEFGGALREALIDMLKESDRFIAVDLASPDEKPELIINAIVTGFEPRVSGGRSGVGGGGGANSGLLGGLLGTTLNKAHIVLEIRIADAATSEVLAAQDVQGYASDSGIGAGDKRLLSKKMSIYADAPIGKAIYACLAEAVRYITQAVPEEYYRY